MNKVELINSIRLDIQKEHDAISTYNLQASKTNDRRVKKVLTSIANEERVHVGELTKLLDMLVGECKYMKEGKSEVAKDLGLKERGNRNGGRIRKHTGGAKKIYQTL